MLLCVCCTVGHVFAAEAGAPASALFFRLASPGAVQQVVPQLDKGDLRSWRELEEPIARSLAYAERWPRDDEAAALGLPGLTWGRVVESLRLLRELLPRLDAAPELLAQHFTWYAMTPEPRFTGYYSPIIEASPVRTEAFPCPIYRLPDEIAPHLAACLSTHTCPDEAFSPPIVASPPYQTRRAIDLDGALNGRGLEMAWLAHPADVYHLMLEGSGVLRFPDGTTRAALFAGLNGHRGRGIAGTLMRKHRVAAKDTTHEGFRSWWNANPGKRRALLDEVPSYVFFRFGAAEPQGSIGSSLVPWSSVAVDDAIVPLGSLVVFGISPEGPRGARRYGLGFAQDTGLAITKRRVDLYTGTGAEAREAALRINHPGNLWMLLKKDASDGTAL